MINLIFIQKSNLIHVTLNQLFNFGIASSVSEAGGLGIITGNGLDAEKLRQQIKLCRTLTDKPFGVNIVMQDISDTVENFVNMLIEENVKIVITSAGSPKK